MRPGSLPGGRSQEPTPRSPPWGGAVVGTIERPANVDSRGTPSTPDFGLQSYFWQPPVYDATAERGAFPCNPVRRNSSEALPENRKVQDCDAECVSAEDKSAERQALRCPSATWRRGVCREHGQSRMFLIPCKARGCEVCGPVRRLEKAMEIAYGVRQVEACGGYCAWFVGTFTSPYAADPTFKTTAVRYIAKFIRWLRAECGMPDLQYAVTWELTKAGVLHVNIIMGPWTYVRFKRLKKRWGARCSIERVRDSGDIGVEAAAAYSPEALAGYLNKLSQAVPRDWGRGISFSKGWARLPKDKLLRRGEIDWSSPDAGEVNLFLMLRDRGRVREMSPVEFAYERKLEMFPDCRCFEYADAPRGPPRSSGVSEIVEYRGASAMDPGGLEGELQRVG